MGMGAGVGGVTVVDGDPSEPRHQWWRKAVAQREAA